MPFGRFPLYSTLRAFSQRHYNIAEKKTAYGAAGLEQTQLEDQPEGLYPVNKPHLSLPHVWMTGQTFSVDSDGLHRSLLLSPGAGTCVWMAEFIREL